MGTPNDCAQTQDNGSVPFLSCKAAQWKVRLISGKPDTSRGVCPVWRGAFGNLPQQCGKALGAYPTVHGACSHPAFHLCRRAESECGQIIHKELLRCLLGGRCHCFGVYHLFALCCFAACCQSRRCGGNTGMELYWRTAL